MYGTVARMRIKAGKEAEMEALSRDQAAGIAGMVFEHVYRMDADPQEYYLAVGFESREAYRANADSPEMHERYLRYRELLDEDPEWHDGEIAYSLAPTMA